MKHENITEALAAFHLEVGTIEKTARAQYGNFADLSTVLSVITPALSRHGLALVQTFEPHIEGGTLLVSTLMHTSGERLDSRVPLVHVEGAGGRQNPLHLWGGSVTYQRRYAALALVGLAAGMEDDDGDIATPETPRANRAAPKPRQQKTGAEPYDLPEMALEDIAVASSVQQLAAIAERIKVSEFIGVDAANLRRHWNERRVELLENPMMSSTAEAGE